ncbi:MAG: hypothetical protein P8Z39_03840 [Gammaproteobacteria bacterium]
MNKSPIFVCSHLAFILSLLLPLTCVQAGEACGLYTKADVETLFKQAVAAGVPHETMLPAGDSCRYSFNKNGETYSLKLRVSHSDAIKKEGIQDSAADVMERQKTARKNSSYAAKKFKQIPNLGTDAFWGGNDLWVLQDDTLLIISIHSFMDGSFPNMQALQQAREQQDKALSVQVAETVLARLK